MVSLEVRFYTLSCNLEKMISLLKIYVSFSLVQQNALIYTAASFPCLSLVLQHGMFTIYENDLICSFMDYVYDGSYCVAVLSS